ncbi:MAG: Bcr/CflA family drug resistance efflux transporter [Chitinophaga sp.]|nr:Bcr/CflA family drug resistance efflux transporter [Chitinophaga sp.]
MQKKNSTLVVFILGLLSAIGPFSIDMYLPSFPAIAKDFSTTVAHVSLSLSSFFIGISFGQLLYGPLLDKYGRKKPLYFGFVLYIIASLGCAVAASGNMLIVLRLFQALGGCVGMVASRAMVRDLFPIEENAKVFSMLMLVVGVSPIIAPTVGGYLTSIVGWHSIFIVLTVMGICILLLVHFYLPESRKGDSSISLHPKSITKNFIEVSKVPQFYTYALTGSIGAAGLYAYISGSPFVFMELFKVSEKHYGWIFAFNAAGLILASQVNSFVVKKYALRQIVTTALTCQTIVAVTLLAATALHWLNLYSTIGLIFLYLCCQGFIFPNTSALAMAPFTRNAGSASAVMGATQMAIGSLMSALVSVFQNNTAIPMTGVIALCASGALVMLLSGIKIIAYKESKAMIEEECVEMIETL